MFLNRVIARQLGNPSGWFGRTIMTRLLNRGNAELHDSVLKILALQGQESVLDIGFGGGALLEAAANQTSGHLAGADRSQDAVTSVQGRLAALGDRLELVQAKVEALPFPDGHFDAVVTTNTVYFWPQLEPPFAEVRRVMAPAGRFVVAFASEEKLAKFGSITEHGFHRRQPEQITGALAQYFGSVELHALSGRRTQGDFVAVARV
jgi:ubiquinone/menaquinone biosynthesis C-methylase UbiE